MFWTIQDILNEKFRTTKTDKKNVHPTIQHNNVP